jgi:hypothetical protein
LLHFQFYIYVLIPNAVQGECRNKTQVNMVTAQARQT